MKLLTKTEEILLLAIWKLNDEAYGVKVREKVMDMTGKLFTYGNLYCTLDQLTGKGFVMKYKGEPTPERGGRAKTFYKLSEKGLTALQEAFEINQSVWDGVSLYSFTRN